MADAFSAAMAALFADPNLSVPAEYTPVGTLIAKPLRAIVAEPGANIAGIGGISAQGSELSADILVADVPVRPKRGALLSTARGTFKVAEAKLDGRGLRWRMALANA